MAAEQHAPATSGAPAPAGLDLVVHGTVQGVGFRPFVHRLAHDEGLTGWVRNAADGVHVTVFGADEAIERFVARLEREAPPLARVERIVRTPSSARPAQRFEILASAHGEVHAAVTPDAALCAECRRELLDPGDRRHRYPFGNCTHCGPRFSIVLGIPYDRARTSMRAFPMCAACEAEYRRVEDRRFHAQPTACAECGPSAWLEAAGEATVLARGADAIAEAQDRLARGAIAAVKGIGGFHLACDATDADAVARLRALKRRPSKPFAVMVRDLEVAARICELGELEQALLESRAAPIVLAAIRAGAALPAGLAPGLDRLGLMLPYSPLHALLLEPFDRPLVMTSGNAGSSPQVIDNDAARDELAAFADAFLMHDRDIVNRVDDSVVQTTPAGPQILRRGRGEAPRPIPLPAGLGGHGQHVVAFGGDVKNAFAVASGDSAVLSQHVGDLDSPRVCADLERSVRLYRGLYELDPTLVVVDPHPGYRSARIGRAHAEAWGARIVEVQHHHAHAASCMAEHRLPIAHPPVLALVQDGLGYGADGALWGAELLLCHYHAARRVATLASAALPGGDQAAREPWRNLLARLDAAFGDPPAWPHALRARLAGRPVETLLAAARAGVNSPPCSSAGRLFDAVAAAAGIGVERQSYEGEAAMRLQAAAERAAAGAAEGYPLAVADDGDGPVTVDPAPLWPAIAEDVARGAGVETVAARFHRGWASAWARTIEAASAELDTPPVVVLSGGVLQNRHLGALLRQALEARGLRVLEHRAVPANDGGIALGQAVVALAQAAGSR